MLTPRAVTPESPPAVVASSPAQALSLSPLPHPHPPVHSCRRPDVESRVALSHHVSRQSPKPGQVGKLQLLLVLMGPSFLEHFADPHRGCGDPRPLASRLPPSPSPQTGLPPRQHPRASWFSDWRGMGETSLLDIGQRVPAAREARAGMAPPGGRSWAMCSATMPGVMEVMEDAFSSFPTSPLPCP